MDKFKTSKLQILRRDFETLSMKDSDSVESFYTHVIGLINQIRKVVEKVLRSFPPKFDSLVVTLEENKDLSQLILDEMQASLINHEHLLNRSNISLENVFFHAVIYKSWKRKRES
jgi:catechol-2,3-dioxygenase